MVIAPDDMFVAFNFNYSAWLIFMMLIFFIRVIISYCLLLIISSIINGNVDVYDGAFVEQTDILGNESHGIIV